MGSGNRFEVYKVSGMGLGFNVSRFPFAVTIHLHLLMWGMDLGFGKGYDQ